MRAIQKNASVGLIFTIVAFVCGVMGMRTAFADAAEDIAVYYNTYGGKYYHFDSECGLVDRQWLPMKQLLYSDLYSDDYNHLVPCVVCAPNDEIIRTSQSNWPMYEASIATTIPFTHERMIDLAPCAFALLCATSTFHAIYNLLASTQGLLRSVGHALPALMAAMLIAAWGAKEA